jgi:hypothetical protein
VQSCEPINGSLPTQGRDYDYSSDSIRCCADRLGAHVFVLEKTEWRKSVKVLALNLEDARSCADRRLPPWTRAPEDGPFGREISKRITGLGDDVLSGSQQRRLAQILASAAREAVAKTNASSFNHHPNYKKLLETALFKVVRKNCRILIDAAATSDAKGKAYKYNEVPGPSVQASRFGEGVPSCSGIYFVWDDGRVVYVGKSSRLVGRCTLTHHAINEGDWLSWIEFPITMLNFAECFYIGALKPIRNFGLNAIK